MTPAGFTTVFYVNCVPYVLRLRNDLYCVEWGVKLYSLTRTVRRQVPTSVFQSLIVALVLSRLDYCNSVLFGLPANLFQRLQSVQNAAARLIFRIRRSEHITPAIIRLHWLRIPERIYSNCQLWRIDLSTAPLRPTYSHVSTAFPTWHPDNGCGLLPHIVWPFRPFVSLQSAGMRFRFLVPPSGTTCLSTSHLRRHSRFSENDSKTFLFSRSYQDTIIWLVCYYHHSSLLSGHLWSLQ